MTLTLDMPAVDEAKLAAFLVKVVGDFGAVYSSALVMMGDKLRLYKALAVAGPLTPAELAERSGTVERYVRTWLINQAAGGYVEYDPHTGRYTLPDEHALVLADESGPYAMAGGFEAVLSALKAAPKIMEAFCTGGGLLWGEHDHGMFVGTERFFRSGYLANLVSRWIPALDGVQEKLEAGATVADVGCGHGAATIILAQAFPRSRFYGYDNHAPSIEAARRAAAEAGVENRVTFEVASAAEYPNLQYDLIAYFDALHDMGDPIGAIRHARETLAPDGTVLLVEPQAGEKVEDNLNPVGRIFSAASVLVCTPNAMASGGMGLGTIATEAQIREVVTAGGLSRFRRATETPFNRVFEARP
ncbi:MAG TPA: methyltransferase domain-containing protein [Ardenticatenaceae bacterium]|nr:methyltransferase domain-containing protein [Ardenticatenaceae bacterium]